MTPTIPSSALESAFQNPIIYGLLLLLIAVWLLSEITGKTKGWVNGFIVRRRTAAQRTATIIGEQPAEIASLRLQVAGLVGDIARLSADLKHQGARVDDAQQREEIRDRLAAEHRRWDVAVVNKLIDLGVNDMPDPPPLHVHPDYTPRETP